jgi:hypothetical protein
MYQSLLAPVATLDSARRTWKLALPGHQKRFEQSMGKWL